MNIYEVQGIPQILENRPQIRPDRITREQLDVIMEHNPQAIFPVSGDCLEGVQVMDGGCVCIDFTRRPAPPRHKSKGGDGSFDLCLCYAVFCGRRQPDVMLKEYLGVWGPWHMVGTRYDLERGEHQLDYSMEAEEIFGVVLASWDPEGRLLWERDPESFPEKLETAPTIHGVNIGDPVAMQKQKSTQ